LSRLYKFILLYEAERTKVFLKLLRNVGGSAPWSIVEDVEKRFMNLLLLALNVAQFNQEGESREKIKSLLGSWLFFSAD
jgi:hypothetical protein